VECLKRLNLIPISYWFEIKDITFFFKCKVGYFDLKLEDYVVQPLLHQTRFSSANTLRNFYFNRVVLMWNNLPSTIKSLLTFSSLKSKLYHYYYEKLSLDFYVDRPRNWKSLCTKCRCFDITCCS
jgi:hypothetical protein